MRLATIAALSLLVVLPAGAVQQRYQTASLTPTCDNDGRCTTANAVVPMGPDFIEALESKPSVEAAARRPRTLDANGTMPPARSFPARRVRAPASVLRMLLVSKPTSMTLKPITERVCYSWVAFGPAIAHLPVSIRVERPWTCDQLRRGAVDGRCNLSGRVALGHIAAAHGLFEGGRWCNSDYGHAQVDVTAAACGERGVRFVQRQSRSVQ